jgi:hypothetical protein
VLSPPVTRSARKFGIRLLGPLAVAVALAAAPAVHAADGSPAGAAGAAQDQAAAVSASPSEGAGLPAADAAYASAEPGAAAATSSAGPVGSGDPAAATANAPEEPSQAAVGPPAGNKSDAAPGQSDAAPGQSDPTPGQSDAAPGLSDAAPGLSDAPPGQGDAAPGQSDAEHGASVAQGASAGAKAGQNGVGNTKVDVRVDQPGNGSPVSQQNRADGNAEATAAAETSTPAISDQSASAAAEGSQSDVQNTAVTVRVGSPGDGAAVEQANLAGATAATSVTPPESGESTIDESAAAAAAQDGATNTNVSIRVFSPGSDGVVSQTNTAEAVAQTTGPEGATATATQNGVQNTSVSVRVESAGTSGAVTQQSSASATAGPADPSASGAGTAVATTENGLDTDVSIVVDGDHLQQPGAKGLQVWVWTWNWDRDESQSVEAALDTQPSSWNWSWGSANGQPGGQLGQVTSRTASPDEQDAGTWTWNWDWTRAGAPNWTWQWDWSAVLPCSSCIWIWNWTWNWTGQPVQTGSAAPNDEIRNITAAPEQANVAVADAEASVKADVTQTVEQGGSGGDQFAGQLASVEQVADATATATQFDVETVATANLLAPQVNRVASVASVTVAGDLAQWAQQTMLVGDDGGAAQWSGQEIDLVQHAGADVRTGQRDVALHTAGTVLATGQATAAALAGVDQRVVQDALVDGGTTDQWAGQLALVEQTGDAVSVVEQTGAAGSRVGGHTARAHASSGALARVDQDVAQGAVRGGGLASQTAMQVVYVGQAGSANATTAQRAGSAASPVASSDASATNRALVVQDGVQESTGVLGLDIQDLTQQSIVVQDAVAVSTSVGGIAGAAVVVNCAIVQQTAAQSLTAGMVSAASPDLSAFCTPPAAAPTGGAADEPTPAFSSASAFSAAAAGPAVEPAATVVPSPADLDVALFHGRPSAAASGPRARASTPRVPAMRVEHGAGRPVPGSLRMTQISVPRPTQARLDTRPGDHAGAGDAGWEPPLPPAGDPPLWVSALAAAAASGAGPSGIAAILLAFALVPPLLVRAREGSVVRRPIGAFSQVDVPV